MLTRHNRAGTVAWRFAHAEARALRCVARHYVTNRDENASPVTPPSEAPKLAFKRTQSILLDEGNPIIHRERYKLHKQFCDAQSEEEAELSPEALRWQSDPYLSMLASPIRRCIWSTRPMPKDLLIPIKAAAYEEEVPADAGSSGPRRTRWRSSIFAREILHRSSLSTSDRAGRKQARGYVICKRDAVHHFMSKGGPWKRLDPNAEANPVLAFQIESQLRRRVVQELELLADARTEDTEQVQLFPLPESALVGGPSRDCLLRASSFEPGPTPAAIIELSKAGASLVPAGASSRLGTMVSPDAKQTYADLAMRRVPVYSLSAMFDMDPGIHQEASRLPQPKSTSGPRTWADLAITHPHIYAREMLEAKGEQEEFRRLACQLLPVIADGPTAAPQVVYVPALTRKAVPLLKALWRWRLWVGEGWSGDGFGMAAALAKESMAPGKPV